MKNENTEIERFVDDLQAMRLRAVRLQSETTNVELKIAIGQAGKVAANAGDPLRQILGRLDK